MGQVIRLPRFKSAIPSVEGDALNDLRSLSTAELRSAISGCSEVRRQIEMLLQLVVEADKIIDNFQGAARERLRAKRAKSHIELMHAAARASLTVAALTAALSEQVSE